MKPKARVLDSWAILEWMSGRQPAAGHVRRLLRQAESGAAELLMSAINVGEVYYFLSKYRGHELAELWFRSAPTMPITIDVPGMPAIWAAATLKAQHPLSYADAFAAQLAAGRRSTLVTGDAEFRSLEKILKIEWIG